MNPAWDADGRAAAALAAAVRNDGAPVLASPEMLRSLLGGLLPDRPREAALLIAAARAGVSRSLSHNIGERRMEPVAAVRLAAADLQAGDAVPPDAALWAAAAVARALGYQVPVTLPLATGQRPTLAAPPGAPGPPPAGFRSPGSPGSPRLGPQGVRPPHLWPETPSVPPPGAPSLLRRAKDANSTATGISIGVVALALVAWLATRSGATSHPVVGPASSTTVLTSTSPPGNSPSVPAAVTAAGVPQEFIGSWSGTATIPNANGTGTGTMGVRLHIAGGTGHDVGNWEFDSMAGAILCYGTYDFVSTDGVMLVLSEHMMSGATCQDSDVTMRLNTSTQAAWGDESTDGTRMVNSGVLMRQ